MPRAKDYFCDYRNTDRSTIFDKRGRDRIHYALFVTARFRRNDSLVMRLEDEMRTIGVGMGGVWFYFMGGG